MRDDEGEMETTSPVAPTDPEVSELTVSQEQVWVYKSNSISQRH